jgi:hypothetical protein
MPSVPGDGGRDRYKLYLEDGSEAGEAHHAVLIQPGETIWTGAGRKLRVLDVVSVEEEDSPFVGLLQVEAASSIGSSSGDGDDRGDGEGEGDGEREVRNLERLVCASGCLA